MSCREDIIGCVILCVLALQLSASLFHSWFFRLAPHYTTSDANSRSTFCPLAYNYHFHSNIICNGLIHTGRLVRKALQKYEICQMLHFFSLCLSGLLWIHYYLRLKHHNSSVNYNLLRQQKHISLNLFHALESTSPFSNLHIGPSHCHIKNKNFYIYTAANT